MIRIGRVLLAIPAAGFALYFVRPVLDDDHLAAGRAVGALHHEKTLIIGRDVEVAA